MSDSAKINALIDQVALTSATVNKMALRVDAMAEAVIKLSETVLGVHHRLKRHLEDDHGQEL